MCGMGIIERGASEQVEECECQYGKSCSLGCCHVRGKE